MVLPATMLLALFAKCGAGVPAENLMSITGVESSGNPFVIANVTDNESYYLSSEEEAIEKAKFLSGKGKNFSAGLMQINSKNFPGYELTAETVFQYCKNISAGADILKRCYAKASSISEEKDRLKAALSCYYSGNFTRGLIAKGSESQPYVTKVINNGNDSSAMPSINILRNGITSSVDKPAAKVAGSFFITDSATPEAGRDDNDDVVNSFVTETKGHKEANVKSQSGNTKTSGSWDIFKDYSGKE